MAIGPSALPHRPHLSLPLYAGPTYVADHFPRRADAFYSEGRIRQPRLPE
jgi:hypothetical protein